MSTKVYDAFIYKGKIEDLMRWLFKKREQYKEYKKKEISLLFNFKGNKKEFGNSYFAIADLIERAVKQEKNIVINYQAQAVVYFHKGKIYVKFFSLPPKLLPKKNSKFIDFHYQNSTDKPNNISQREWNYRERTWDEIMKYNSFGENGLTLEFTPPYFGFEIARYIIEGKMIKELKLDEVVALEGRIYRIEKSPFSMNKRGDKTGFRAILKLLREEELTQMILELNKNGN